MHKNSEEGRKQREKESVEWSRNMKQIVRNVENREQNKMNDFLTKHKDALELIAIYLSVVASSMIPFESIQNFIAIIFGIAFLGLMFEVIITVCEVLKKIGRIIYNNVKMFRS